VTLFLSPEIYKYTTQSELKPSKLSRTKRATREKHQRKKKYQTYKFTQKWVKVIMSSLFLHLTGWGNSTFPTGTFLLASQKHANTLTFKLLKLQFI